MPKLYTKNTWVDETLAGAELYNISGSATNLSNVDIKLATAVNVTGSLVNASRMNNIETGIDALDNALISGTFSAKSGAYPALDTHYVTGSFSLLDGKYVTGSFTLLDGKYQAHGYTVQILSASGTYTPSAGTKFFEVEVVGGGGGAGGAAGGVGFSAAGGGGGGGGYARAIFPATGTFSYSVGNGGAGGVAGANNGTNGQASIFGGITCNGGIAGAGMATGTAVAIANGGGGNSASGGDINIIGGSGQYGIRLDATNSIPGFAGSSQLGQPVRGGTAVNADGLAGQAYGTGGSGGRTSNNATNRPGGAGANGVIIIKEFKT